VRNRLKQAEDKARTDVAAARLAESSAEYCEYEAKVAASAAHPSRTVGRTAQERSALVAFASDAKEKAESMREAAKLSLLQVRRLLLQRAVLDALP
jgi:hypothetical protein